MKTLGEFKAGDFVQLTKKGVWYRVLYFQGMNYQHCHIKATKPTKQRNSHMACRHRLLPISTIVINWGLAEYIDKSIYPGVKDTYGHLLQRLSE